MRRRGNKHDLVIRGHRGPMGRRVREQRLKIGRVGRVRFRRTRLKARRAREGLGRLVRGANRFIGRTRPPLPDTDAGDTPTKSVRASVLSATLCLGVAALLVSGKIVEIADRLPLGPDRDRWLEAATETDHLANRLALNRPYDLLRDLRGAGDDAGQQVDVIGDVEDLLQLGLETATEQPPATATAADTDTNTGATDTDTNTDDADTNIGAAATDTSTADADTSTGAAATDTSTGAADTDTNTAAADADTATAPAGEHAAADTNTNTAAAATDTNTAIDTDTNTATTVTTTVPEEPRYLRPTPVSADAPLRTWVVGDSQAFYLGHSLRESQLSEILAITVDQRHSTGLARPGYFNWPVHFFAIAANYDPEVVVATLGSNDWQGMTSPDEKILSRGSDEWRTEWSRRLAVAFDVLEAPHRHVIWVGLPPTRSDETRRGYATMNELATVVSAERDFVTMIDIWGMFGGDEPYREAVPPPGDPDGRPVDVRQQDGVHLNQAGARWVIDLIDAEIERIIAQISPEPATAGPDLAPG